MQDNEIFNVEVNVKYKNEIFYIAACADEILSVRVRFSRNVAKAVQRCRG